MAESSILCRPKLTAIWDICEKRSIVCDVTAMSHVAEASRVPALAVSLAVSVSLAMALALARRSHVISNSIYSPDSSH
jgi:hypothetical protein